MPDQAWTVPELLQADELTVEAGLDTGLDTGTAARHRVVAAGRVLAGAEVTGLSVTGELQRFFGSDAKYPFTVTIHDATGAAVLVVEKHRERALLPGFLRVTARLADGREIGTARRRRPLSGSIEFSDTEDVLVARADSGVVTRGFRVVADPGGDRYADVVSTTAGVRAAPLPARTYAVTFAEQAPVLVRALTVGYLLAADLQLYPL